MMQGFIWTVHWDFFFFFFSYSFASGEWGGERKKKNGILRVVGVCRCGLVWNMDPIVSAVDMEVLWTW